MKYLDEFIGQDYLAGELESTSTYGTIKDINITLSHAKGVNVWDNFGNKFMDLTAGSGVHNVGHNHPKIVEAIVKQLGKITHSGWQFYSEPRSELLKLLKPILPFDYPKFIFTVTGSEAVEAALKLARTITSRYTILGFQGGFHGKTGGSLEVTANPNLRKGISNLSSGILRIPYPSTTSINDFTLNNFENWLEHTLLHPDFPINEIAGIIVEPVQGPAGMIDPPTGFLNILREFTQKYNILLIIDEIYTGFGRTGKWFGFQHDNIKPDIMIIGKSLGGGLPLSLVIAEDSLMKKVPSYLQTSTFSGHPLACAAACSVLKTIINENLVENANLLGLQLRQKLTELSSSIINFKIAGKGLMLGLYIESENADILIKKMYRNGLLALRGGTYGNVIKITPPLTISENDINFIIDKLKLSINDCQNKN